MCGKFQENCNYGDVASQRKGEVKSISSVVKEKTVKLIGSVVKQAFVL